MNRGKRPLYLIEDVARATGQVRLYYRRDRDKPKIRIWHSIEHVGFWPAYEAAKVGIQLLKPQDTTRKKRASGVKTFEVLCHEYYRSAEFRQLAPVSQRTRMGILKHCCDEETKRGSGLRIGDTPAHEFGSQHVKVLRDRKGAEGLMDAANNRVKAIRGLFAWHLRDKPTAPNPCAGFGKLKGANKDGFHSWTLAEVAKYEDHHPVGSVARLAFDLALYTAHRRSDVVRLGPEHVEIAGGVAWLSIKHAKTAALVELPILEPLAESIAARPSSGATFLQTSYGKPYTSNGMGGAFRGWCDQAGLPNCTMHGLRKAAGARLAALGCSDLEIQAILGHAPGSKQTSIYTRAASRRLLAESAMAKLKASLDAPGASTRSQQPLE